MPGITRKLAGVVKIHEDPLVYVHDSPGVMVPFLGHGELGSERGLKFALTGNSTGLPKDTADRQLGSRKGCSNKRSQSTTSYGA